MLKEEDALIDAKEVEEISESKKLFSKETLAHAAMFRLACEVGRIQMSYDELSQLETGKVIQFDNTSQFVHLTVDGTRVGEGMLVEIDGKIGVKVTRWYQ